MAYTTINKSSEYFSSDIWSGNSGTQTISAGGQRDMTWFKVRNGTRVHRLQDAVRGVTKALIPNDSAAEGSETTMITAFNSSGYTIGSDADINASGSNYVGWSWKANGAGSANTDGSISSTVSANTTSGFSIVSYTGTGANATVGHGLGVAPSIVLCKNLSVSGNWIMYHSTQGATKYMVLNATDAVATATAAWNDTAPTSSVFSVSTGSTVNGSGNNLVAYCFAEKKGFSKFGSYVSNANVDGAFVYTGFKPAFIIVKNTSAIGNWFMLDNKRNTYNPVNTRLTAEGIYADDTGSSYDIDFVSNGFKLRTNSNPNDGSGNTYIYMAFAENPLVGTNNVPATAR